MDNTYMSNESSKLARVIRKLDQSTKNYLQNKQHFNKYGKKRVYKMTCTNCSKFYRGTTNKNLNTRFKENKRFHLRKYKFSEQAFKGGHGRKLIE